MRTIDDKGYKGETLEETKRKTKRSNGMKKANRRVAGRMSGSMEEVERMQGSEAMASEVRESLKDSLECYQSCTETVIRCLENGWEALGI